MLIGSSSLRSSYHSELRHGQVPEGEEGKSLERLFGIFVACDDKSLAAQSLWTLHGRCRSRESVVIIITLRISPFQRFPSCFGHRSSSSFVVATLVARPSSSPPKTAGRSRDVLGWLICWGCFMFVVAYSKQISLISRHIPTTTFLAHQFNPCHSCISWY